MAQPLPPPQIRAVTVLRNPSYPEIAVLRIESDAGLAQYLCTQAVLRDMIRVFRDGLKWRSKKKRIGTMKKKETGRSTSLN